MRLSRSEPGLAVSAVAHAAALILALIAFSDARKFDDAHEAIAVETITDEQLSEIMKGEKSAKEAKPLLPRAEARAPIHETRPPPIAEAKKDVPVPPPPAKREEPRPSDAREAEAPAPPKRVAALPPSPPPLGRPKAAPEPEEEKPREAEIVKPKPPARPKTADAKPPETPAPEPRLKTDEVAKLLERKKREEQASPDEAKEKPAEKPKARPKSGDESAPRSRFDATSIASVLSREAPQQRASTGAQAARAASLGSPTADAPRMSASIQSQIDAYTIEHYRKCWQAALSLEARGYAPRVEFRLTRDGALEGAPRLLNPSADPIEKSRGEQALAAVRRCSPMPIPAAFAPYYDYWRVTELDMREEM